MEELGDCFKCKDIVPDILAEEERKYNREIANLRPILEGKTLVIMTPLIWRGLVSLRMNPPGVGSTRRVCFLPLRGCASNAYGSRLGANHLNYGQITKCEECVKHDRQTRAINVVGLRKQRDKLRSVWNSIKYRCFNPKCTVYKHYGGRGITMCKEWSESYKCFREWSISHGYSEGLTIERIDVNGNYCPENCRYVTMREQTYNRRESRRIIFNGKEIPIGLIAHELGVDNQTFYLCLKHCSDQ